MRDARAAWAPVWVVIDGSSDGTAEGLQRLAASDPDLRVLVLPSNQGKGAALLHGMRAAQAAGFTHALSMDADGQHPADRITAFMVASQARPDALVLGVPVFDASAPALRVKGRRVSNWWANLETLWAGIDDSLCGFRVYPIAPLCAVMGSVAWMRRFDFDPEEGGVSHFNYLRDNALLAWMHLRLMAGFTVRLPMLLARRLRSSRH